MDARPDSLAEIEAEIWRQLGRAAADKQHPWRRAVLATVNGEAADARTVVLREVDTAQREILFYTDERAGKVRQLLTHPRGTLVLWWPERGWQLRCRVWLSLETSGLATSSRWARIKLSPAAQDYLSPLPPGTPLPALPAPPGTIEREYFAVVAARVDALDWLELDPRGHRRAGFGEGGARWLQP